MRIELKPCPFCGGTPEILDEATFYKLQNDVDGTACISIECDNCKTEMFDFTTEEKSYDVRALIVSEKWNRRV